MITRILAVTSITDILAFALITHILAFASVTDPLAVASVTDPLAVALITDILAIASVTDLMAVTLRRTHVPYTGWLLQAMIPLGLAPDLLTRGPLPILIFCRIHRKSNWAHSDKT
ncbi:MAG TPA: hypothetical protein DIV36_02075 [Verrucomicrobiales bacterium]|nr:hypothetical protein [Verrucomicrobiales bacterium]